MSASSSVHSNAFNFMSFLQGGVDPRTGQYTLAVDIPTLKSHELRGPEWPLRLAYSPLNTQDSGFGTGWNLQLSQFDIASFIVSVHTGETYKVDGRSKAEASKAQGDRWSISEQKLDSFHFHELPKGGEHNRERYRVVHRNGLVEILERMETGSLAFPVEVYSAEGHRLSLAYEKSRRAPEHFRLASIWEGAVTTGTCLFQVVEVNDASGEGVALLYRPDAQGQALARYFMKIASARVTELHLPVGNEAGDPARWRLTYAQKMGLDCISRVMDPRGGVQEITYAETGHEFPRDPRYPPRDPLPRVATHLTRPGHGQPDVEIGYSYPDGGENFLGGGLEIQWDDDGLDNLFKKPGRYRYGSTETLKSSAGERVIVRWFNQFHLLVEQTTTRNGHVHAQHSEYGAKDDVNFKDQVRSCQLPVKNTTSWTLEQQSRTEIVERGYDAFGNLAWEVQNTGVREEYQWYPAAGEPGLCPADPEGFVRHLKDKTVIPAPTAHGSAPTLRYRYRYAAFKPVAGSQQTADWHAQVEETLEDVSDAKKESVLQVTQQAYYDDPAAASAVEYGRVKSRTVTLNGLSTRTDYRYHSGPGRHAAAGDEAVLVTEQTVTGHDHAELAPVRKVVTYEHSMHHGEPLLTYDDQDVQIRYSYDAALRVTQETVAPGSEFEASRDYAYVLCAYESDQAKQRRVDVKGVVTESLLDGLGRAVEEKQQDHDFLSGTARTIYRAKFNELAQLVEEIEEDWVGARDADVLTLKTVREYDDWGNELAVIGPDGTRMMTQTSPQGSALHKGPIVTRWRVGTDGLETARSIAMQDLFGNAIRIERRDANMGPTLISLELKEHDGLGRLVKETLQRNDEDINGRINEYTRDVFGRILSHTLPDRSVVSRTFALHSSEDLPISIVVADASRDMAEFKLGEQTFDGLDRQLSATTGGRLQTYRYDPGMTKPASVTMPNQELIRYEYEIKLHDQPTQRVLMNNTSNGKSADTIDFTFDHQNARLVDCMVAGVKVLERTYHQGGQLKTDHRQQDGARFEMTYSYSRQGRLLSYKDVLGETQVNTYNADNGQLSRTTLGTLSTVFSYDGFGRVSNYVTSDSASQQTLRTDLEYDELEREQKRTFTWGGSVQTLTQGYYDENDTLQTRVLKQGNTTLRSEQFIYDQRQRLERYTCTGSERPEDPYGNKITGQTFVFDGLDNIREVTTTFDGGSNLAIYTFASDLKLGGDPVQLRKIDNDVYPDKSIELTYDDNGNMTRDEKGNQMTYNVLNQLVSVTLAEPGEEGAQVKYSYDPLDVLNGTLQGETAGYRSYQGDQVAVNINGGESTRIMHAGEMPLAEQDDVYEP
ncbi:RHS repeat domain-containing protein [Pseudomonas sichuanensis]